MVDATTAHYLSFTTRRHGDGQSWNCDADSIRLQLAAALESAGAEIDTEMHRLEVDWLFYGVRDGIRFTVVLAEISPHLWFTFFEGSTSEERPDPAVRAWAFPIIETTLRTRDGAGNFHWHDSHLTLPKP